MQRDCTVKREIGDSTQYGFAKQSNFNRRSQAVARIATVSQQTISEFRDIAP